MTSTAVTRGVDDGVEDVGRRSPRRRLVVVLVAVGVLLLAAAAVWVVGFSRVLGVRAVAVRGTSVLSPADVRGAAAIADGTPLIRVDTAAVTRRVEGLADVASARVSRTLPSTVTITVTERRPVAYVQHGTQVILVDRTGKRYRTADTAPAGLPLLVAAESASTDAALAAVAAALPAAVRAQVRSLQALDADSITLLLRHGRLVRWGSAARSADKARVLPVLLRGRDDQIDVSDPDHPYTH